MKHLKRILSLMKEELKELTQSYARFVLNQSQILVKVEEELILKTQIYNVFQYKYDYLLENEKNEGYEFFKEKNDFFNNIGFEYLVRSLDTKPLNLIFVSIIGYDSLNEVNVLDNDAFLNYIIQVLAQDSLTKKHVKLNLWSGAGYTTQQIKIYEDEVNEIKNDMEVIEKAMEKIIKLELNVGWIISEEDELYQELSQEDEHESWLHVDLTNVGLGNYYLQTDNFKIE